MIVSRNNVEFLTSISKIENPWKVYSVSSSPLRTFSESLNSPSVPPEVQKLVQELAKIEGVTRVRAVAPRAGDLHWIDFQLELQPETELSDESWDKIQNLVIHYEWGLRDQTQENWYFDTERVEKFEQLKELDQVVFSSEISWLSSKSSYNQQKSISNFLIVA